MEKIVLTIGETYKQLRLRKYLTRREMGWMAGIDHVWLKAIENNSRLGRIDTMEKIANFLGSDWFEIYCGLVRFNIVLEEKEVRDE
jgi:transcriptional regulator with XRE-family HTH domain